MSPTLLDAIVSGRYEHKEAAELRRIIEPGERVLEIGGGIGFTSALTAQNPNTAAVRVFEGNPDLLPFIRKVHDMNEIRNVEVANAILMNDVSKATASFYIRQNFWASSLSSKPYGYERVVEVEVKSFNAEIEAFRPTLVICDIEGGEVDLFRNANLTGVKKVYLELHQKVVGRRGIKSLFDSFSARNFHYDQWHSSGSVVLFSEVSR